MASKKQKDLIDEILSGGDESASPETKALDCLIYRNDSDLPEETSGEEGNYYEKSSKNVTVRVWDSKAKIRVKVSPDNRAAISIERIADLIMDAILKELKKERL